jgi:hypothetical protein
MRRGQKAHLRKQIKPSLLPIKLTCDIAAGGYKQAAKPAPVATIARPKGFPKKAMKVLRQMANGRRLIGVETWGAFWLTFKRNVTKVKLSVMAWLIGNGYIARAVKGVMGWSLTGAGHAAVTA